MCECVEKEMEEGECEKECVCGGREEIERRRERGRECSALERDERESTVQ